MIVCHYNSTMHQHPTLYEEKLLKQQGYHLIAGIDEVGRGPLAGPVMAAAVILPLGKKLPWLKLVRDSKQLTASKRELLYNYIIEGALAIGVGSVCPETIDALGIISATRLAMRLAVEQLHPQPDFLLIDAIILPDLDCPQKGIIRGDGSSLSIATASIIAKVTRDHFMIVYDGIYSNYGFARHKGYPTREHLSNLRRFGASLIHRKSFAPVRKIL